MSHQCFCPSIFESALDCSMHAVSVWSACGSCPHLRGVDVHSVCRPVAPKKKVQEPRLRARSKQGSEATEVRFCASSRFTLFSALIQSSHCCDAMPGTTSRTAL